MFLHKEREIHNDMIIDHIDFHSDPDLDDEKPKVIRCISSRIKLNLLEGSEESMEFLDLIAGADDDVLYTT